MDGKLDYISTWKYQTTHKDFFSKPIKMLLFPDQHFPKKPKTTTNMDIHVFDSAEIFYFFLTT